MKKISFPILLLAFMFLTYSCNKDSDDDNKQVAPTEEKVFLGSLINPSDIELQEFYDNGYDHIKGDVIFSSSNQATSLEGLSNVKRIDGNLSISSSSDISSLIGLNNITSIGGNTILSQLSISSLNGLNSLKSIGQNLEIINIILLENLSGLEQLDSVYGSVSSYQSSDLNPCRLSSLDGFTPEYIGEQLEFYNYEFLNDYCSIKNFLTNEGLQGGLHLNGNLYNPSQQDIINGNCIGEDPTILLDGTYIVGPGIPLTEIDIKGKMKIARNEVTQEDRSELVEIFMSIQGGGYGFQIVIVDNGQSTTYGPASNFVEVTDLGTDEPTEGLWRGNISENSDFFMVPENGLYHIAYDSDVNILTIAKVEIGIIGAATPGGWASSTQLTEDYNINEVKFKIYDLTLARSDYKFRYSNGWEVILDENFDLGDGNKGIKVNSNWGGTFDNLVMGGDNMTNDDPGIYTVEFNWSLENGFSGSLIKTGDLGAFDYSETELGFIGDGIINEQEEMGDWNQTMYFQLPISTGLDQYSWIWNNIEVSTEGSFKIREGNNWDQLIIGNDEVNLFGASAGQFSSNGDGNFVPLQSGFYNFVFHIDAITETYSLEVNPSDGPIPEIYILGDATLSGWDNTIALPLEGENGNFEITTDLELGYFKFITTLGQWAPMYGTDEYGNSYSGNLVFRETESDPDPVSIEVTTPGTYLIQVDLDNLNYTVTPAK